MTTEQKLTGDVGQPAPDTVPCREVAGDYGITRTAYGAVAIRTKSPHSSVLFSGKVIGFTMPAEENTWQATWINEFQHAQTVVVADSITAEAVLFERLGIAPPVPAPLSLPAWEDLTVSWVADDDGRDLITVVDIRTSKPVLELSPDDALAIAAQMIGQARDAFRAGA